MSKLQRLRDNIEAIRHALTSSRYDADIMNKYSGFGGMTFLLNTLERKSWSKTDKQYYEDTVKLRQLLHDKSQNEDEYQAWMQSLKASTLTAYYTPREIPQTLFNNLYHMAKSWNDHNIYPKRVLDPSAGTGMFMCSVLHASLDSGNIPKQVGYELDLLTGTILKQRLLEYDIRIKGFETIPNEDLGTFDLVTTNVPFGNISVFDPAYTNSKEQVKRDAAKMIHRYYVLKGLDCLRNGGLLAYIITSNYLNRDNDQLAEALKQANLVTAIRFANNLFHEAGTEVGTDLLILQKDESKQALTDDEKQLLTPMEMDDCPTNLYFNNHPDHVIATSTEIGTDPYGKPGYIYHHENGVQGIATDMDNLLKTELTHINRTLFSNTFPAVSGSPADITPSSFPAVSGSPAGTLSLHYANRFFLFFTFKQSKQQGTESKEQEMKALHQTYSDLYNYEAGWQDEDEEGRLKLNNLYDSFIKAYGFLNESKNASLAKRLGITDLLAIERYENGSWVKADIMLAPVAFSTDDEPKASTPQEALAASLNKYGKPDIDYMLSISTATRDELLNELHDEIFYNPINGQYEIRAKFLSGNVIEKLEIIHELCTTEEEQEDTVKQSIAALEASIPTPIPFEELDFNLGERWIDVKVYEQFANAFFSMPDITPDIEVRYNTLLDQYAAGERNWSGWNEKIRTQYSVQSEASNCLDGLDLFIHALHNTTPKLMKYLRDEEGHIQHDDNYDKIKIEDTEKMQLAATKIEEIRQAFEEWLRRQPREFKDDLANVYNRRFNCFVKPKYDGSHQTFPDLDMKGLKQKYGINHIYNSQKDCVWMLLLNGGGICDHEVGSGKTLIMCIAAHEMKRLGLCHKPMIIGMKANVSAIAETYRTAYPNARILFATESDYSASNRVTFFNNAKNNDYDCIIMSHDQFGRIPQSEKIQLDIMRNELQQIEDSLAAMEDWGYNVTSRMRRGLETRKRNLHTKILNLQNSINARKDDIVDFGMLGIDHIFIDESHQFKNLGFVTRHDRVAGIGNTEGSKRAFNLLMAIRTIQERTGRDLGATFLSGTTVTNSLTELFCLFKYLRPEALRKQAITCFDAWAAIFTKKSTEFEFNVTNCIVQKERFRYFIKVPELAMFYNEITDFRTAEDVGIDRPEKHARLLNIKPTPDQEDFINRLMKFAQGGSSSLIFRERLSDNEEKARMLICTDLARKMSLDMRLIDPRFGDHPCNKASQCANLVKKYYDQYDEQRGTQLIFSDVSTWQNNTDWSVYSEIKRKLMEMGIPGSEIRFMQECKSDRQKQLLIEQVNLGYVRVLFGSTSMLGTGVNLQERVVAVHHLDTPWRPSDLEQRDGRAIRKGNEVARIYANNQVDVIIYAVERSLDSYKFNLLHLKQTFINQLKRGQLGVRTIDEGSMDENGMNFSEYMAILSGNTDLLERAKLEKRIAMLEAERKNFFRDQREQEEKMEKLKKDNALYQKHLQDAQADLAKFNRARRLDAEGNVVNDLHLDGLVLSGSAAENQSKLGNQLIKIANTARTQEAHLAIGSIYGFKVLVKTVETATMDGKSQFSNMFFVSSDTLLYSFNNGYINRNSPKTSALYPLNALQHIPEIITGWAEKIEKNENSIQQIAQLLAVTNEWHKEQDLKRLKKNLKILDKKIEDSMKKKEQPVKEAA